MTTQLRQIISVHPHSVLRTAATEVTEFGELLQNKIARMKAVMRGFHGVGIAANQCFMSDAIFVAVINGEERVFINPHMTDASFEDTIQSEEGCLSMPGIVDVVTRFSKVTLSFQDQTGERKAESFEREAAVVVQHEMDHLYGILFCDKLSDLKQDIIERKMRKFKKSKGLI